LALALICAMVALSPAAGAAEEAGRLVVADSDGRAGTAVAKQAPKVYFTPSAEVVTPHVKWARPYAGGKTRALFLVDLARQREIVELAQRFDIEYAAANVTCLSGLALRHHNTWVRPNQEFPDEKDGRRHAEQLVTQGGYDCIVIGDAQKKWYRKSLINWTDYTETTRRAILEQVREQGVGLVYVHPVGLDQEAEAVLRQGVRTAGPGHYVTAGIPFDHLDKVEPSMVKVREYGKGRIVVLDYPALGLTPYYDYREAPAYGREGLLYWEYHLSLVGRALLWAARKDSAVDWRVHGAGSGEAWELCVEKTRGKGDGLRLVHRDRHGELLADERLAFDRELRTQVKGVRNGLNVLDVWLTEGDKVLDWRTSAFAVERETGFTARPLSVAAEAGTTVSFSLDCKGVDAGCSLELAVTDALGRLEFKATKILRNGHQEVGISLPHPYTTHHTGLLQLRRGGRIIETRRVDIYTPSVGRALLERFSSVVLGSLSAVPDYLRPRHLWRLYEMGFDAIQLGRLKHLPLVPRIELDTQTPLLITCWNFLGRHRHFKHQAFQRLQAYQAGFDKKHLLDQPSALDPEVHDRMRALVTRTAESCKPYGLHVYVLDDETAYQAEGGDNIIDTSFDPLCLERFREWLKREYVAIERLNQVWGSSFAGFEEAVPLTYHELTQRGGTDTFAAWADFKSFMDAAYLEQTQVVVDAIRGVNPQGIVGESGFVLGPAVYNRSHWRRNLDVLDFVQYYRANRFVSSMHPDRSYSPWLGYAASELSYCESIWRGLFHGDKFHTYYYSPTYLLPDLRASVPAQREMPYIRELGAGLGDFVSRSRRARSLVAIRFDQKTLQAALALKPHSAVDTHELYRQALERYAAVCEAMAVPYEYVDSSDIGRGRLIAERIVVLVLPLALAMSRREAMAVQVFARTGGTVLADTACGLYDEHLKRTESPALSTFFGVAVEPAPRLAKARGRVAFTGGPRPFGAGARSLRANVVETNVAAAEGTAVLGDVRALTGARAGAAPALFYRKHERGRSLYLGCVPERLAYAEGGDLLSDLLAKAGVEPMFRLARPDGTPWLDSECMVFRRGAAHILTVLPLLKGEIDFAPATATVKDLASRAASVRIRCRRKMHLHEVRTGEDYGCTDVVELSLAPLDARVFVALPYKVAGIRAHAAPASVAPGRLAFLSVQVLPEGGLFRGKFEHPVQVEVFAPDGAPARVYSGTAVDRGGGFLYPIQFACNDPSGAWTAKLKDIASGAEADVQVNVRE